ncbi:MULTISPECIES: hypothetical protein [unclassified Siphonobacter]|nr:MULTISPECIES: hypothetical protein [unclassified Siphonobacter]MDQ1086923.1 hypothetical protein [Siphonobacter sp. SORGH_AS_1065]MDR6193033.1 hypothetical protein [Siphonobacter sp. SORGH_AS_0500]
MKIYPERTTEEDLPDSTENLTPIQIITRKVAIWVALASVFVFFFKLLFF